MPQADMTGQVCVAIDFETSGREGNSACAVGLTRIEAGCLCTSYYTLLKPPSQRVLFSEIHGLTWQDLKDAPTFAEKWDEIASFCQGVDYFLAHNASFDRRVLAACLRYADLPACDVPFLCTLKGARKALRDIPSRSLDAVCRYFSIPLQHHHAASDARACAEIFLRLKNLGITEPQMLVR